MQLLQNYDIWLTFYIYLIIILAIWLLCAYERIQPTGRDDIIAMPVNLSVFQECA